MTLSDRVRARLAFDKVEAACASVDTRNIVPTPIHGWGPSEGSWFVDGARWENSRNAKLFDALCGAVEALGWYRDRTVPGPGGPTAFAFDALKAIEAALGKE